MSLPILKKEKKTNLQTLAEEGYSFVSNTDGIELYHNEKNDAYAWYIPGKDAIKYLDGREKCFLPVDILKNLPKFQFLVAARADRQDHPPGISELCQQSLGHARPGSSDNDGVIRRKFTPAE